MTSKKIVLITYEPFPSFIGLSTRVRGLALALKEQGWEVHIVAPAFRITRTRIITSEGLPVHQIPFPDIRKAVRIPVIGRICFTLPLTWVILRFFWRNSLQFDYIQSEQIFPLFACWVIARKKNARLIFDDPSIMGLFIRQKINIAALQRFIVQIVAIGERIAAQLPDYIICSSIRTRDYFQKQCSPRGEVLYLPNGIEISHATLQKGNHTALKIFFNCTLPYYQNVAALRGVAGIVEMLDAEENFAYQVRIVVNDTSFIPGDVKKLLSVSRGVSIASSVPSIQTELQNTDVIILPYGKGHCSTGGGRLKALEALASGGLVFSTIEGVDGIPDLVDGEHFILCSDHTDMGAQLKLLLHDHQSATREIRKIGMNARKLMIERYSWNILAKVYNRLNRTDSGDA